MRSIAQVRRWSSRTLTRRSTRDRQSGSAISEVLKVNGCDRHQVAPWVAELFAEVGLPASYERRLPSTLSGGERQRVAIARALPLTPPWWCATSRCRPSTSRCRLRSSTCSLGCEKDSGLSYLFITHDLAVVRQVVDRVYVCLRGEIVEQGAVARPDNPQHEYTRRLIDSIPGTSEAAGTRRGSW